MGWDPVSVVPLIVPLVWRAVRPATWVLVADQVVQRTGHPNEQARKLGYGRALHGKSAIES
jgi:hypothetical protein